MLYYIKLVFSSFRKHIDKFSFNAYNVSLQRIKKNCSEGICEMSLHSKKIASENEFADVFAREFPTEEDALRYIEQQADLFSPDNRIRRQKIHSLIHDVLFSKHISSYPLFGKDK